MIDFFIEINDQIYLLEFNKTNLDIKYINKCKGNVWEKINKCLLDLVSGQLF